MKKQLTFDETLAVIGEVFQECRAFWRDIPDGETHVDELALRDIETMTTDPRNPRGEVLLNLAARNEFIRQLRLSGKKIG